MTLVEGDDEMVYTNDEPNWLQCKPRTGRNASFHRRCPPILDHERISAAAAMLGEELRSTSVATALSHVWALETDRVGPGGPRRSPATPRGMLKTAHMDLQRKRLVEFVTTRLAEDAKVADEAVPGFDIEATSHITSEAHALYVRRFGPGWMAGEVRRKLVLVQYEIDQSEALDGHIDAPYPHNVTRLLATAWRDHPDFDQAWL